MCLFIEIEKLSSDVRDEIGELNTKRAEQIVEVADLFIASAKQSIKRSKYMLSKMDSSARSADLLASELLTGKAELLNDVNELLAYKLDYDTIVLIGRKTNLMSKPMNSGTELAQSLHEMSETIGKITKLKAEDCQSTTKLDKLLVKKAKLIAKKADSINRILEKDAKLVKEAELSAKLVKAMTKEAELSAKLAKSLTEMAELNVKMAQKIAKCAELSVKIAKQRGEEIDTLIVQAEQDASKIDPLLKYDIPSKFLIDIDDAKRRIKTAILQLKVEQVKQRI